MADYPAPVATQIQPPDPGRSLQTLSGILGLQRQQQQLQTGQYQQQEQQALAQQQQQAMGERQQLQSALRSKTDENGESLESDSVDPVTQKKEIDANKLAAYATRNLPLTGADVSQRVLKTHSDKIGLADASRALQQSYKDDLSGIVNSYKGTRASPVAAIEAYGAQNPQAATAAHYAANLFRDHYDGMSEDAKDDALSHVALQLQHAATTAEQTRPQVQAYQGPGNELRFAQVNPLAGRVGRVEGGVLGGVAPAQQPGFQAQVAAATGAAAGQAGTDVDVFKNVMTAGANAQRGVELAQKVEQDAASVRTGKYSKDFADRLTVLKQHDPSITARQLLQKDAENLKALAEQGATTDKEREQIGGGFPSPDTMNPDAIQKAARYWQGSFRMAGARRDNALQHVTQSGSTAGLTVKDASFMRGASPDKFAPPEPKKTMPTGAKLTKYADTHFGGDVAKATAFLKSQGHE